MSKALDAAARSRAAREAASATAAPAATASADQGYWEVSGAVLYA